MSLPHNPCVNSGYCCKVRPCPFGESVSDADSSCKFLELIEQPKPLYPRFLCGKYDEILASEGNEISPAFGAGCCSPLFNVDRDAILKDLKH